MRLAEPDRHLEAITPAPPAFRYRGTRRLHVKANHILDFFGKGGIVGLLKGAQAMGLKPMGLPDALDRAQADARRFGNRASGLTYRATGHPREVFTPGGYIRRREIMSAHADEMDRKRGFIAIVCRGAWRGNMPDIYASITAADPATLERLVAALELRAADLLQRGILKDFVSEITLPKDANYLKSVVAPGR